MNHTLVRLALAGVAVVAPFALSTPADAGTVSCTTSNIDVPNLDFNVGGAFNCTLDNAGTCTFFYDPLFNFPNNVAPATVGYANCLI